MMINYSEQSVPQYGMYVVCKRAHENNVSHGLWVDLTQDIDEISKSIDDMLSTSPFPGEKEWIALDYAGFSNIELDPHLCLEELSELAIVLNELNFDEREAFICWYEMGNDLDTDEFREHCRGCYDSLYDFAVEYIEQTGLLDGVNSTISTYFDFEMFGRDMELGGDIWTSRGACGLHVFFSN